MGNTIDAAALAAELAALRAAVAGLRSQADAAQDYIAIANLQASYGYYVDKGLWDEAADLFSRESSLEIAGRGVYKGQDRIRQYLNALPEYKYGVIFNHMQLQPVIHIAPDRATAQGRWRAFIQVGFLGGEARWGEAVYENAYVREDGVWKIASLHAFITYYVEYDQGWNKGGVPLLTSLDGMQPDAPPTHVYEAYPGVYIPPFHYANPVTGKRR